MQFVNMSFTNIIFPDYDSGLNKHNGIKMNKLILVGLLTSGFMSMTAHAECIGTDSYSTCSDDNGNVYDVTRYGGTTEVSGHNNRTGTTWRQTTEKLGNQTETRGTASNGAEWEETRTETGGGNYTVTGVNAQGERYDYNCSQAGCQKGY